MLKIGVDAMGGDFAPEAAVKGAVMAVDAIGDECRIVPVSYTHLTLPTTERV